MSEAVNNTDNQNENNVPQGEAAKEVANNSAPVVATAIEDPKVAKAMQDAKEKAEKKLKAKTIPASELVNLVDNIENNDSKILAQLLVEMKKENEQARKYAFISTICSICSAVLFLIFVSAVLIFGFKYAPVVNELADKANDLIESTNILVEHTNEIVEQANTILDSSTSVIEETTSVIENLNKITGELAETDFNGLISDVNSLVVESEESIGQALEKIEAIDIESLNEAIVDLKSVVEPLSKLFKKK